MQDYRKVVGNNVRALREQLGISQEELGFRSNLDRTYVSGVERGVPNPTVIVLARLATALGVEPSALLETHDGK